MAQALVAWGEAEEWPLSYAVLALAYERQGDFVGADST